MTAEQKPEKKHIYDRLFEPPQTQRDRLTWLPRNTPAQRWMHALDNVLVDVQNWCSRVFMGICKWLLPIICGLLLFSQVAKLFH